MEIQVTEVVIIPVVVGLVEISKRAGLPAKYSPFLAIALAMAGMFLIGGFTVSAGIQGLVFGLSSSGLYSGTKSVLK